MFEHAPKKIAIQLGVFLLIVLIFLGIYYITRTNTTPNTPNQNTAPIFLDNTNDVVNATIINAYTQENKNVNETTPLTNSPEEPASTTYTSPLDRPVERISKKPFGIRIDPATSPIQPERFSGYHTGADFEVFPEEISKEVSVKTFCEGNVLYKKRVSGYGGVLIQLCTINDQQVTVLYGHLDLASIVVSVGDKLTQGQIIGNLGDDKSTETDGERKHLHFAIHKGTGIELKGYVATSAALTSWFNPQDYVN